MISTATMVARNIAKLVAVTSARPPEVVPLTIEEARSLLGATGGSRLYALWSVALAIGLRRGEALGLRWRDVDLVLGELRVSQTLAARPPAERGRAPDSNCQARSSSLSDHQHPAQRQPGLPAFGEVLDAVPE